MILNPKPVLEWEKVLNFEFFFIFSYLVTLLGTLGGCFRGFLRVYFIVEKVTFPMFDRFASVLPIFCSTFCKECVDGSRILNIFFQFWHLGAFGGLFWGGRGQNWGYSITKKVSFSLFDRFASVVPKFCSTFCKEYVDVIRNGQKSNVFKHLSFVPLTLTPTPHRYRGNC